MRRLVAAFVFPFFASAVFAQESPQSLTITLTSYAFAPAGFVLKANAPVTLHLVNSADKSHDFTAREFFAASAVTAGDQAKVKNGTIELAAGQSLDVTVTPGKPGTFPLKCTHFMHSGLGMTGSITVQ